MPWSFWASYLLKLGLVGLLLGTMYAIGCGLRSLRRYGRRTDRSLCVLETAVLSQHATVYLLKVGARYFLVGAASASMALLAELAPGDLTTAPGYTLK